jgi:hypothetical protein
MNNSRSSTYQSYMLRLWRDHPRTPWQASLQSTATEHIYHFADLEQMWAFLQTQLGVDRDDPKAADAPPDGAARDPPA